MAQAFNEDKIEKIEKVVLDKPAGLVDSTTAQLQAESRVKFDEALAKANPANIKAEAPQVANPPVDTVQKPSLLDIAGKTNADQLITPPTPSQVLDRAELTRGKFTNAIDLIKQNLSAPVEIAPAARASMTASLQHADRYLNQATKQVTGVESKSAIDTSERPPLLRFLSFLTEGERRLDTLIDNVQSINKSKTGMTPGDLIGVQIRLGFVQTELEFFTNVLSKSLDATKTIMNVQI